MNMDNNNCYHFIIRLHVPFDIKTTVFSHQIQLFPPQADMPYHLINSLVIPRHNNKLAFIDKMPYNI